jgi:hypothetical protein
MITVRLRERAHGVRQKDVLVELDLRKESVAKRLDGGVWRRQQPKVRDRKQRMNKENGKNRNSNNKHK